MPTDQQPDPQSKQPEEEEAISYPPQRAQLAKRTWKARTTPGTQRTTRKQTERTLTTTNPHQEVFTVTEREEVASIFLSENPESLSQEAITGAISGTSQAESLASEQLECASSGQDDKLQE